MVITPVSRIHLAHCGFPRRVTTACRVVDGWMNIPSSHASPVKRWGTWRQPPGSASQAPHPKTGATPRPTAPWLGSISNPWGPRTRL